MRYLTVFRCFVFLVLFAPAAPAHSSPSFEQPVKATANPAITHEFTKIIPMASGRFADVTGESAYTVTSKSQSPSSMSHNLDRPSVVELPAGSAFSDNSTTSQFFFTDTNSTPGESCWMGRINMRRFQ